MSDQTHSMRHKALLSGDHASALEQMLHTNPQVLVGLLGGIMSESEYLREILACQLRQEALVSRLATAMESAALSLESIDGNTERRGPGRPKGT